ncbi:hypothetical protein B0T14DRAFT_534138 [Immersiella caudata]|uniref:NADAR domain-containing protein n=1 Tax=Immersiella caudata TaxID=314043 RepID=A0AA40C5E5_9PEZI|nr:hypothetical protein B0T14DRAFT_534138 [Immersiella caudata]
MAAKGKTGTATSTNGNILFFYMPDVEDGEICQWYPSPFSVTKATVDSLISNGTTQDSGKSDAASSEAIQFICAEQFKMYCKAGRSHDAETQRKIMVMSDPKTQKRLGKTITARNMAKFGQNPKLKRKLLASGDKMLVEAKDRAWGIGYTAGHAMQI